MSGCTAQRDAQTDGGLQDNAFMDDPFEDDEQFEEVHCSDCCGGGGSSCVGRGMSFERQRTEWKRLDAQAPKRAALSKTRTECWSCGAHDSFEKAAARDAAKSGGRVEPVRSGNELLLSSAGKAYRHGWTTK